MKISFFVIVLTVVSCTAQTNYRSFGEEISSEGAIETKAFLDQVSEEESPFLIKGVVEEVCQMKGCWMTIRNDDGELIRVTFKDYAFFVPKDIAGREVVLDGIASSIQQSEEMAKHYAEDAGKEYSDSMKEEINFVARGVLVKEGH